MEKFYPKEFAQFFFFTHVDESKSSDLSNEAIALFSKLQRSSSYSRQTDQNFVRATYRIWKKYPVRISYSSPLPTLGPEVISRKGGSQLNSWTYFLAHLRHEEYLALIWSEVFSISSFDLAQALNESQGTIQYRLQKGLIKIGQDLRKQGSL